MKKDTSGETLAVLTTGLLGLHLLFDWNWAGYLSLAIGVSGIISPWMREKIAGIWINISGILGLIVPKIILSIIYFGILFPLALLAKLGRKDPLLLSRNYDTYFIEVEREPRKADFEKIW